MGGKGIGGGGGRDFTSAVSANKYNYFLLSDVLLDMFSIDVFFVFQSFYFFLFLDLYTHRNRSDKPVSIKMEESLLLSMRLFVN